MKMRILRPAYETEDGYAFEACDADDFPIICKAVGEASSYKSVIDKLTTAGVRFRIYKVLDPD